MDIQKYLEQAREKKIYISWREVSLYYEEKRPRAEYLEYLKTHQVDPTLDPQDVWDFFEEYYSPETMDLVLNN